MGLPFPLQDLPLLAFYTFPTAASTSPVQGPFDLYPALFLDFCIEGYGSGRHRRVPVQQDSAAGNYASQWWPKSTAAPAAPTNTLGTSPGSRPGRTR